MASKSAKSASAGGGPGTHVAGQVKSTMTPTFGMRNVGKKSGGGRKASPRAGRSR